MVLNPNENYQEVEIPARSPPLPSPGEPPDEPAEKRERRDDKESKKKREFYEKYRNPQKETETDRIPIRVRKEKDECQRRAERRSQDEQKDRCRSKGDINVGEHGKEECGQSLKETKEARTMGGVRLGKPGKEMLGNEG